MLNVQLSKPDDSRGEWVNFPAPYTKTKSVFDALADEEHPALLITAAESSVSYLHSHLVGKYADREQSVRELDFLARRIEGLTEQEQDIFSAMLEIEQPRSLMELVNLSCNMDKFDFFPKIISEKELGEYLLNRDDSSIPEQLAPYIDYELVGSQYVNHHAGRFTDDGYVVRTGEALKPVYDGKHLPDPAYDANGLFLLRLYSSHYANSHPNTYSLSLPASEEKLALARENLGVSDLDECSLIDLRCSIGELENYLPYNYTIDGLNDFAALLKSKVLDGTEEATNYLCAVLEAEIPEDIQSAYWIAARLREDYFVFSTDIQTPEDYGHDVWEQLEIDADEEIYNFVDWESYGRYRMKKDGIVQTTHGMVFREGGLIRQIPEELTTLKLFSPLYPQLYERNEWGDLENDPVSMSADELCGYQDEILAAIERENLREEGDRGLAVYLRNELLKRKVFSMNPTVEEWNGRLWGVLEVQSYQKKILPRHHDRSVAPDVCEEMLSKLHLLPEHLRCMYLHLWSVGLRISEVCTLKGNAYYRQEQDAWIQVYQIKMKTYKRIPISDGLYKIMQVYIRRHGIGPDDYLFTNQNGGAYRTGTFRQQMQKFCRDNDVDGGDYLFQSHDYRHTVATLFYDCGVSLQSVRDYLGHNYEEMTQQYIDYVPRKIAKASEEYFKNPGSSLAAGLRKGGQNGR